MFAIFQKLRFFRRLPLTLKIYVLNMKIDQPISAIPSTGADNRIENKVFDATKGE